MSEAQGRRLSAILMADIVGYTKLVEQDTDGTVTAWKVARADVIDPAIGEHAGHVVKYTGDGFLAEFSSVQNAVNCAIHMQRDLGASPLDFRIGISLGDIVDDGTDIHGEGVNIAARIEALAEPGGVCISGDVYNQARNRVSVAFEDMGEHAVKHVSAPVRVYRIAGDYRDTSDTTDDAPHPPSYMPTKKPSIAVLPFDYMSGDPEHEYFADGISEDILTALSRYSHELTVIDRHSSFTFKGKQVTAKQVGEALNATYMLEGSVRRGGARVRITAQLIDCSTGNHLWAERYDRSLEDLFEVQDEITRHIATALTVELVYGEYIGNWMRGTENFDAWDAMIKAAYEWSKLTREGHQASLAHVDKAIAVDPDYGPAIALKVWNFAFTAAYFSKNPAPLWVQAREWAGKALSKDTSRHLGLGVLGYCDLFACRYEQATEAFKEALSLAPTGENNYLLGKAYLFLGRTDDCIAQTEQAMRLSPICPAYFYLNMIDAYRIRGEHDTALMWVGKCIDKMPESSLPLFRKAGLLSLAARQDEALAVVRKILARDPEFSVTTMVTGQSFSNPEHIEPFAKLLRELGLPD